MRRMNSMFHGHHGASARTPCMYRSMASRVAGSSHDSGRWTIRDGDGQLGGRRQLVLARARPASTQLAPVDAASAVDLHEQRADAGGDVDDAVAEVRRPASASSACTRSRSSRSSVIVAVLDEQEAVAGPAVR